VSEVTVVLPLDRGSPTGQARWVHQEIQRAGWWGCRLPGTRWALELQGQP